MARQIEQTASVPDIAANLAAVRARIASAAEAAGRSAADVTLVAVSKGHGVADISAALEAGQRVFGENRVQEAQAKWPPLKRRFPDIALHLIGPLQTNKVAAALELFDVIETLDRPKLAGRLRTAMNRGAAAGKPHRFFVQVNTGEEPAKSGVPPREADGLLVTIGNESGLPVAGLMCIPPVDEEPSLHFALLRKIAVRNGLQALSMGMSGDFETAVAFGATHVRVGTAIFGPRPRV